MLTTLKNLSLTIGLFLISFLSTAQNIQSYFASQQPNTTFEKLYLHTDREFYFIGDTLWFSAYLVEGQTHNPIKKTFNLYVDLINTNNKIIGSQAFPIINGHCDGWVSLNDTTIPEGNYMLRAYTDYLKKFGNDAFFNKKIQISSIKNSFELETFDSTKTIPTNIDVSFLPEGGFLLAGHTNFVAFKAVDESGKGIDITGKLLDENGDLVLNFQSVYKGAGKIYFNPEPGKSYTAKIDSYPDFEYNFTDIREVGAKINLNHPTDYEIPIIIQATGIRNNIPYYLVCLNRGKGILAIKIDKKNINTILKIEPTQLRAGINRFVLLNSNFVPVSERLVFIKESESFNLDIQLNKDTFKTREKVKVQVFAPDNFWDENIKASVSVVDENYVNASGVTQNIKSYLLLDSELKGNIESPADYFIENENLSSNKKLDLLMTVNGWSNYVWNHIDTISSGQAEPQIGFTFKGNVKKRFGNKALEEGSVFMIIFNEKDSTAMSFDQQIDSAGKFEFRDIVFYDSVSVFAQARNKNDNHNLQFEMELPMLNPPDVGDKNIKQLHGYSDVPVSLYRQRYLNEMHLKEYYPDKSNILIDEVQVTANKPEKYKTGTPKKNNGAYKLTWEQTAGSSDIIEYLAYHVPGITPVYSETGELYIKIIGGGIGAGIPGIFIDGFLYTSYDKAKMYNINNFASVEIITPPQSTFLGARAINGAVILNLKSGDDFDPGPIPLLGGVVERIKGFSADREFYSPRYTAKNVHFEKPDYRNTLYWNPRIKIDSYEELTFFTCDNLSRYKIFIEGLSEFGNIFLGEATFEINQKRAPGDKTQLDEEKEEYKPIQKVNSDTIPKKPEKQLIVKSESNKITKIDKNLISGIVRNKSHQAVEFATIYNITKKTSCITDDKGIFKLDAEIGDSIRIQHLNYMPIEYKIINQNSDYELSEKSYHIDEVEITAQYAFRLFNKSCENTFNSFKDKNLTQAYCKVFRKDGSTLSQNIDLDLDISQKKYRKFKKGEKIIPYRIQEHITANEMSFRNDLKLLLNFFYPLIHEIYWVELPQHYNYYKKVDDENIVLYLISKASFEYPCNIEVTISKQDTLLKSFAMVKKNVTLLEYEDIEFNEIASETTGLQDTLSVDKTYHYIQYKYDDGFGYLDEYIQGFVVSKKENNKPIEVSQYLKTYNNGADKLEDRPFRRKISGNSFIPEFTLNRYETEFWKNDFGIDKSSYDFNRLSHIQFDFLNNEITVTKQNEPDLIVQQDSSTQSAKTFERYYLGRTEETLNFIAGINNAGIDEVLFMPYYMKKGKPYFSKKFYTIADMIPTSGDSFEEIKNKILEVYYSHETIQKTEFGCKNFTCNEDDHCIVFPFNGDGEILADGFAIYILKEK